MKRLENYAFLETFSPSELPSEYLAARVKGKRSHVCRKWEIVLEQPDPAAYIASKRYSNIGELQKKDFADRLVNQEYRWLYLKMNPVLRKIFYPFFALAELRKLIACLRFLATNRDRDRISTVLAHSLLAAPLLNQLLSGDEPEAIMKRLRAYLTRLFEKSVPTFDLKDDLTPKKMEEAIHSAFFEECFSKKLHPVIRNYLQDRIDYYNILLLYRHIKWHQEDSPIFLSNGTISADRFSSLTEKSTDAINIKDKNMDAIRKIVLKKYPERKSVSGESSAIHKRSIFSFDNIENYLVQREYDMREKRRIQFCDVELFLHYLILLDLERRNSGVIIYGNLFSVEQIGEELIA